EIVSTAGCKPQHVKSLVDRGFAQYTSSDEQLLEKADIDLNHAIAALQKSDKYLAIWEYLRKEEGSALASDLRSSIGCTRKHLSVLEQADIIAIHNVEVWRDPLAGKEFITEQPPKLTDDQAVCWERISLSLSDSEGERKFLLHGVTGSGKTEIYLRAIDQAVKNNKQAIVLVPEIALTPQTVRRFAARFPDRVAILHSRLSAGERFDTWRRARQGDFDVVIGPRSALFAPLERLGVIVIDEEHDEAYKQDPPVRPPYYHAREAAIKLVELCNAVLIMGSATPDVVTYHRAQRGEFGLLELPKRIMGHREWVRREAKRLRIDTSRYQDWDKDTPDALAAEMPPVQMVDMRHELRVGNMSIFSRLLRSELSRVLDSNQQAILFLNRRGTSTYVFCRDCGYVLRCPHCDMPLTYHRPNALLVCHHCGETERQPEKCPVCSSRRVKYFGLGTEGVEQTVINDFPQARILRWDRDTTGKSSAHEEFLLKFVNGEADILIGTQMVAKGLDLPLVTLVGVISADVSLGLPDYRTGERTFQVLAQVAGRAGRGLLGGRAIFQTFNPEHYAVRNASEHDYGGFYAEEMAYRMNLMYPPYRRLARLEYQDPDKHQGRVAGIDLAHSLQRTIDDMMLTSTEIIGPNQPFFHRIGGRYRWQIVIRSPEPTRLLQEVAIPRGWRVDIEPMSLL
ncbi:MAG: primosomal protein N', partial [Chloroflexota bacterium]